MKAKKIEKRLFLSKKTIANLSNREMRILQGGGSVVSCPCLMTEFCPTWIFTICEPDTTC